MSEKSKLPSGPPNSQLSDPHNAQLSIPSGPPNSQLSDSHNAQLSDPPNAQLSTSSGPPNAQLFDPPNAQLSTPSDPPNSQLSTSLRSTKLSTVRKQGRPTKLPPAKRHRADMWVKYLDLRHVDKDVIAAKAGMLSDTHMYAAHKLLRLQFPHLEGCYTTLLVQKMSYPLVTSEHCSGIIIASYISNMCI